MKKMTITPFSAIDVTHPLLAYPRAEYHGFDAWWKRKSSSYNTLLTQLSGDKNISVLIYMKRVDDFPEREKSGLPAPSKGFIKIGLIALSQSGCGWGQQVMQSLRNVASGDQVDGIYLTVLPTMQRTINFLSRQGFRKITTRTVDGQMLDVMYYQAINLLISVHPGFVDAMRRGEKQVEYRKQAPKRPFGQTVIYETAPSSQVAIVANTGHILKASPAVIWRATSDIGGVQKNFYDSYFNNKDMAVAIELKSLMIQKEGLPLSVLSNKAIRPPQGMMYIPASQCGPLNTFTRMETISL